MRGQRVHAGLFGEICDKGMEFRYFNGIKLRLGVGGKQLIDTHFRTVESIHGPAFFPATHRVSIDDCTGHVLFLLEKLERDLLFEEVTAFEINAFIKAGSERFGVNLHALQHALSHCNTFGVNDEFFGALAKKRIQHA